MRTSLVASIIMISLFLVGNVMESHAGEAYLKNDRIKGGTGNQELMKLLSYEWGEEAQPSGSVSSGRARRASRANFKNLVITMYIDKSFPKVAVAVAKGESLGNMTLTEIHPATKQPILTIQLRDAMASSISLGNTVKEAPTVSIEFIYSRIEWTYHDSDKRTGKPAGNVQAHWDLTTNTGG